MGMNAKWKAGWFSISWFASSSLVVPAKLRANAEC